ncbi:DUF4189 domain-containing protein, partial [Eikenella sp. HMSC073A11]|uniref:DUF4189 domain-containing protein n=2 Tax=unclassified Eikenella TaxID=2639367 RepID=UPI0008BD0928
YFLLPLLLLAISGAWACDPAQGTGQCGYQGYGGVYSTYGEAQDSYRNAYPQPTYVPQQIYVPPPTPQVYTPPPIRESRYGAVAYYENPNGQWNSRTMFASVHNISSKQRARQMALQACNRKSGRTCKIIFDYTNHCASVATGNVAAGQRLFAEFAPQRGQAALKAMQSCLDANAKGCEFVMQEECSLPIY